METGEVETSYGYHPDQWHRLQDGRQGFRINLSSWEKLEFTPFIKPKIKTMIPDISIFSPLIQMRILLSILRFRLEVLYHLWIRRNTPLHENPVAVSDVSRCRILLCWCRDEYYCPGDTCLHTTGLDRSQIYSSAGTARANTQVLKQIGETGEGSEVHDERELSEVGVLQLLFWFRKCLFPFRTRYCWMKHNVIW
jgi:hypothetical protein